MTPLQHYLGGYPLGCFLRRSRYSSMALRATQEASRSMLSARAWIAASTDGLTRVCKGTSFSDCGIGLRGIPQKLTKSIVMVHRWNRIPQLTRYTRMWYRVSTHTPLSPCRQVRAGL